MNKNDGGKRNNSKIQIVINKKNSENQKWLIVPFLILILVNAYWIYQYNKPGDQTLSAFVSFGAFLLKSATSIAEIFINVVVPAPIITIDSPQNTTYRFDITDTYTIELNVSANKTIQTWWYKVYNETGLIQDDTTFTPNITFTAILGSNTMAVFANTSQNVIGNSNVTFSVTISNAAPEIINLSGTILVCEDSYLSYIFNTTDANLDTLTMSINPVNPYFITKISETGGLTISEIFTGLLTKTRIGTREVTISASDGYLADTEYTNISVIEINHEPVIETIDVKTIWVNDTWYEQINSSDTEDGNYSTGNLTYNLTFITGEEVFNITSTTGIINYTPNDTSTGNYNISICVTDRGLPNAHTNISYCQPLTNGTNMSTCTNFQLTITGENRAPNITDYYPLNYTLTAPAIPATLTFNASATDPDGTTPIIYWSINGVIKGNSSGSGAFGYTFIETGVYNVSGRATDGELNDTVSWDVHINNPTQSPTGGGGGGGKSCVEKWGCDDTSVCQDPEVMKKEGLVNDEILEEIRAECINYGWEKEACGVKLIICEDINECKTTKNKPKPTAACYYTKNPSCYDNIKNCHEDACEVLIDCGGPCNACPTCNDKKQNQGEEGIDCGGPCSTICPEEKPKGNYLIYIFILIALILLIAIIIAIRKLTQIKNRSLEVNNRTVKM